MGGKVCLDVGASTGGFTDCLLQRGAAKVIAVDGGTNQLDWRLRNDPRVLSLEKTNARYLRFEQVGEKAELATVDVSFISAELIVAQLSPLLKSGADLLVLVKPQFEVGRGQVGKGGIVRDLELQQKAVAGVQLKLEELGIRCNPFDRESDSGSRGQSGVFLARALAKRQPIGYIFLACLGETWLPPCGRILAGVEPRLPASPGAE